MQVLLLAERPGTPTVAQAVVLDGADAFRGPLLDHVIESVARFPEPLKLNGFTTKPLLRELGMRYQPCTACGGTDLT